jgi:hypothetical protein
VLQGQSYEQKQCRARIASHRLLGQNGMGMRTPL